MVPTLLPANQASAENMSSAWNPKFDLSNKKAMLGKGGPPFAFAWGLELMSTVDFHYID